MIITKKKLKLFHFENYTLTMTLLPRNVLPNLAFDNILYTCIKN